MERLTTRSGFTGVSRRRGPRRTSRVERVRAAWDLFDRNYSGAAPDQLWVAAITCLRTCAGLRYLAAAFGLRCKATGLRASTGSVGDAYDNASWESFFATIERKPPRRRIFEIKA